MENKEVYAPLSNGLKFVGVVLCLWMLSFAGKILLRQEMITGTVEFISNIIAFVFAIGCIYQLLYRKKHAHIECMCFIIFAYILTIVEMAQLQNEELVSTMGNYITNTVITISAVVGNASHFFNSAIETMQSNSLITTANPMIFNAIFLLFVIAMLIPLAKKDRNKTIFVNK